MCKEWSFPDAENALKQGDFLICRNPKSGVVIQMCLVITADCDISKGKFGSHLACLQAVSFQTYLRTELAERKLLRAVLNETKKVCEQMNKWNSKRLGAQSSISPEAVQSWVRSTDVEQICAELEVDISDAEKFKKSIAIFRDALLALDNESPANSLERLLAFRSVICKKSRLDCRTEFLNQTKADELSDDVFFMPDFPQVDCGAGVILLRNVIGIPLEKICLLSVDATSSDMFIRVGRLDPTFKYAISQAFGTLYSRIGLPSTYEKRCETALGKLTDL